jgi:GT2 family glycosyltransferase
VTKVLIGIPTLNGPSRLDRLLKSIKQCTDLTDVTVLVSDDCSSEENLKLNKDTVHIHGASMLVSDQRLGITKQWNRIVRHIPEAGVVVLLNDDVEVVPDWLDVILFSLEKNPHIGTIGLRSEFGVISAEARPRRNIDYHDSRIIGADGSLLWSSGPCFAFRRSDWEMVGGFDERYFMYYVDADFGVSLQYRGKVNCVAEYPVIYHMGGATMTYLDPVPAIEEGRRQFADKWQQSFATLRDGFTRRPRLSCVEWNSAWKKWQ